jgi:chromosome segregation ATPase
MLFFMAVMEREVGTEKRLDDFKESANQRFDGVDKRFDQVDKRFDQVDQRFDRVEADIRELRSGTKKGFERVDDKFDALQSEMNGRFDSMQRMMVVGFVTLFTGIVASIITAILAG